VEAGQGAEGQEVIRAMKKPCKDSPVLKLLKRYKALRAMLTREAQRGARQRAELERLRAEEARLQAKLLARLLSKPGPLKEFFEVLAEAIRKHGSGPVVIRRRAWKRREEG